MICLFFRISSGKKALLSTVRECGIIRGRGLTAGRPKKEKLYVHEATCSADVYSVTSQLGCAQVHGNFLVPFGSMGLLLSVPPLLQPGYALIPFSSSAGSGMSPEEMLVPLVPVACSPVLAQDGAMGASTVI